MSKLQGLAKAKALKELQTLVKDKASLKGLALAKALKRQNELRSDLGMSKVAHIEPVVTTPLNIDENQSLKERRKAVESWLRENLQGKTITTVDGKQVRFNRNKSIDHMMQDVFVSKTAVAKAVSYVAEVFTSGEFVGREKAYKERKDKFVAFHAYRKWVDIDDLQVHLQVKAGELDNGLLEAGDGLIAYSLKDLNQYDAINGNANHIPHWLKAQLSGEAVSVNGDSTMLDSISQDDYVFLEILEVRPYHNLDMGKNQDNQKVYVDTLVFNRNQEILLVQRHANDDFMPNKWWIAGGKLEPDETPKQGAIRELAEETGVKLSDLKFVEKVNLPTGGISHRFAGVVKDDTTIHLEKDELQAYAWVHTDKLGEYELLGSLGDLQDLVELGSEIAGFDGDVERDDEMVVIDGKEFKNHNLDFEQESNKQLLRDEVRKYLENLAGDNGKYIFNHFLGRDVLLNGRGIREMLAWSHQVIKLQILHGIEQIIKQARGVGNYKQINGKKDKKAHAEYYYHLETPIQLASMKLTVKVIIEEDVNGLLQYDVRVPRTALGKNKALYDTLTHDTHSWNTSNNAYAHHNNKLNEESQDDFVFDRLNANIGVSDMLLNLFVFDENGNEVGDEILGDGQDGNDKTDPKPVAKEPVSIMEQTDDSTPTTTYQLADKATPAQRQKDNDTAVALMRELMSGRLRDREATPKPRKALPEEKAILSKYTGTGGNLVGEDGLKGSDYEYYTPIEVASSMWDLAKELGFNGGAVLDPSAGTGIFKAAAPTGTLMHSVELSDISGNINALINDDDTHKVTVSPFEKVASSTDDETFDMVMTNVPFGTNAARGANKQYDKLYQKDSLEEYFIKRSLDKLKPNKLAMFIVPTKILDGANYRKFRHSLSLRAELVGAYRLPNKVFDKTGADVTTDIIVLRKFASDVKEKIDSLNNNGGQKLLEQAKILDANIITGKYFDTYGKKFVLGEYQTGKGRYGDVVRVVNDDSLANILKLVRKFGDSRIDYSLLDVQPIVEQSLENGDVRVLDGQTYEYQHGQWTAKETQAFDETPFVDIESFVHHKPSKAQLQAYFAHLMSVGKKPDEWLTMLDNNTKNDDELYYYAVLNGVAQALAKTHSVPYASRYPELTQEMGNVANSYHAKRYKAKVYQGLQKAVSVAFSPTGYKGLSDYWYDGQGVQLDSMALNHQQAYENAVYNGKADNFAVDVALIKQSNPDFNPLSDDDFCINHDGTKVTMAKDYYVGNYGEFLARIDDDIAKADDPKIKEKLLKQKAKADTLIAYTNVSAIKFGLMSSIIPTQLKYRFFNEFVDSATILVPHNKEDKELLDLDAKEITSFDDIDADPNDDVSMRRFLLNRIFISINNNRVLSVDKAQWNDDNAVFSKLNGKLTKYFNELNINFHAWLNTQKDFMAELEHAFNAPENKEFVAMPDSTPFEIVGFKPKYENFKSLHDYQFEEVRRLSRSFGGICGFGVGLGKTSTALATIQNMHNIGVKKRTFIVVPNHTISKWAKDIANMYDNISDVLVIGTDENKNDSASNKHYASDFALLTQTKGKQYRKIIMTAEAFGKIPMRQDHIIQYFDKDTGSKRSDKEKQDSKLAKVVKKLNGDEKKLPYFEDMAVDSIVMDEAQMYKNGLDGGEDFNRIAGLSSKSLDALAARALSARVKSWWVRGQNKANTGRDDGVVLLTATPFTNSPIEIMTMLSLAVGDEKTKKLFGGHTIHSVNDFLSIFANIESIEQKNIVGEVISLDMFTGFANVELLKQVIHQVANIQTAKDRGLKIPDEEHISTSTELSDNDKAMLSKMKQFYKIAKLVEKGDTIGIDQKLLAEYRAYQDMIKEPDSTIGHAFSMINRMSELTLVGADMAIHRNVIIHVDESQIKIAQKVADEFNTAKKPKPEFKTTRNYPLDDEFVSVKYKTDEKTGEEKAEYTVKAHVSMEQNRLILNVDDATMLANLMQVVEKHGLNIKPKLSAKVQAMMENVKLELATPKHQGYAKQLIFCDVLSMHQIIKQALISECGVPKSQIAILNAQTLPNGKAGSPDTEDVQEIQDLFADNHYTIVIANKKAETGIDLQKGTQAIHHLTTGWTPDSLEQRNGRGVRQGNTQDKVTIYAYNANGTFDEYKRNLIGNKANWIDSLMDKNSEIKGVLTVASQLSEQDYEDLMEADNAEAIAKIIKAKQEREQAEREKRVQAKNTFIFNNMAKARQLAQDTDFTNLFKQKLLDDLNTMIPLVRSNAGGDTAKAKRIEKAKLVLGSYAGLDIDKLWKLVERKAEQRANSHNPSASMYDIEQIFVDEQKLRQEMNFPTMGASPEQWNELKKRKEQAFDQAMSVDNEAVKRIQNIISSRKEMLESTKQAFLNNDDSQYSRDERQAIVDGRAAVYQDTLLYDKTLVQYQNHQDNVEFAVTKVYDDGGVNFITNAYQAGQQLSAFEMVKESQRQTAIEFFVDFDFKKARENDLKKQDYRFSALLDEVREALFAKIDAEKGNYDNELLSVSSYRLIHKESGRAVGDLSEVWDCFVPDEQLTKVKQAYYAPMIELLGHHIPDTQNIELKRKDVALFGTNFVSNRDFYTEHLSPFLLANGLTVNAEYENADKLSYLAKDTFWYDWNVKEMLGIENRKFTPTKEYDELVQKLAQAKFGGILGNLDRLLGDGLESVFTNKEIGVIKQVLGERSDIDPVIVKKETMLNEAKTFARKNGDGIDMVALADRSRTLYYNRERLKEICGQDKDGNYLYKWSRNQSAWYVALSKLDELMNEDWFDFGMMYVETPKAYE